jgi:hypothetical protein
MEPGLPPVLYGWECSGQLWHGPTELPGQPIRRSADLDPSRGWGVWKTKRQLTHGLPVVLITTARDLTDCAMATIDTDYVHSGPASILAAVGAQRRSSVRSEFAFALTAFASFLEGPCSTGSELAVHEHIQQALDTDTHRSIVIALCARECMGDLGIAVSQHIEETAILMLRWAATRDSRQRESRLA